MKINLESLRQPLQKLIEDSIEDVAEGGFICIDRNGDYVDPNGSGAEKGAWNYKFIEVKLTDDEFELILNPSLRMKNAIDLTAMDIPDTVPETLDYLWDDIAHAAAEYEECFA